jgi:hypothetical protein
MSFYPIRKKSQPKLIIGRELKTININKDGINKTIYKANLDYFKGLGYKVCRAGKQAKTGSIWAALRQFLCNILKRKTRYKQHQ